MPTKTWKKRELQVAKYFNTSRNPLSGSNAKHSLSDSLHPHLFVEHKHRKRNSTVSLFKDVSKKAAKEEKIPVVTLSGHGFNGFLVVVHCDNLQEVLSCVVMRDKQK